MVFFDFLYYLIYKAYARHKEKGAAFTASSIIGGLIAINVLTVIFLIGLINRQKIRIGAMLVVVLTVGLQVFFYIKYVYREKPSIDEMKNKWQDQSESSRTRWRLFAFLYVSISVISAVWLAFYVGAQKWKVVTF